MGPRGGSVWILLFALAALGCDDGDPLPDAGPSIDAAGRPMPSPPSPPEALRWTCPDGWTEQPEADGPTLCHPFGDFDPRCAGTTAAYPGSPTCAPIGPACPAAGAFAADLPASGVLYVRAGASGGDGTEGLPFATIAEALAVASTGDTIALAAGRYEGMVEVGDDIRIVGACAAETILTDPAPSNTEGVVTVQPGGVTLRDLSIADSGRAAIWAAGADRSVRVEGVLVHDVALAGVNLEQGATMDAERLVVRDVRSNAAELFGRGLTIETGAHFVGRQLVIERTLEAALLVFAEDTVAEVQDVTILDVDPRPDGFSGTGMVAASGARLVAERVYVHRATEMGALALRDGAQVELRDAVVEDTRARDGADFGRGIGAQEGGNTSCERCLLRGNHEVGAFVAMDADLRLTDVAILETQPRRTDGEVGRGVSVQQDTRAELHRIYLARNHETGVVVALGEATITDLVVREMQPSAGLLGMGAGRGVTVMGGTLTLSRASIEDGFELGVLITERDAMATIEDIRIRDIGPLGERGLFGAGIYVQSDAVATVTRVSIEATRAHGVATLQRGELTLRDAVIRDVAPTACSEGPTPSCPGRDMGFGLGAYGLSRLDVARFDVSEASLCGVHVGPGGFVTLRDGAVRSSPIGACVNRPEQDYSALTNGVIYVDNGVNLDTGVLPVPDVGSLLPD